MTSRTPDLICLGAQKAATTWLYNMLFPRPEVFLPPIKELHYFSQIYNDDARVYGPGHRAQQVETGLEYFPKRTAELEGLTAADVDDDWYRAIFAPARPDQLCVDICPSYMNMPLAGVQHLMRLNPCVRLLVLVRDPIDRCWSQIRMHLARKEPGLSVEGLIDGSCSLWSFLFYTDYAASLRRWRAYTAPGQVQLIAHDAVSADPFGTLTRIYRFAGMPDPRFDDFPRLRDEVFRGSEAEMPVVLRQHLMEVLAPQYDYLETVLPDQVAAWRDRHAATRTRPEPRPW